METVTVTGVRDAVTGFLALLVVACGAGGESLRSLYGDGYRELEAGDLSVAKALAEEGLRRARDTEQVAWIRAFEVLDAEILLGQRQIPAALQRLRGSNFAVPPGDLVHARALMTRGYALCLAPDGESALSRADADLQRAARIADALGDLELVVDVTLRRGTCSAIGADLDRAEALYRETMKAARTHGFRLLEAQAAGNLGNLLIRTSHYDDASRWLRHSQELTLGLPAAGLRLKNLGDLGWSYYRLGDYERAVRVLSRAESLAGSLGYTGDRLIILRNLGRTLYRQGEYQRADRTYRHAAAIARAIKDREESTEALANIHATRAALALEDGRYGEAASRAEQALRIQAEHGLPAGRQRTLLLRAEIWERRGDPSRAAAIYDELIGLPDASPEVVWEAHAALAHLHARSDRPADAEAEYRKAFQLMETSLTQLLEAELRLPFISKLDRFYDGHVDFLVAEERVTEALHAADESRARLLQERLLGTDMEPAGDIDFSDLARDLDALLLFYWTAPERSFLWTITADGVELTLLPGEEELESLVAAYQERILASRDPVGEADRAGLELYRMLVEPAAPMASGERVIILPDGPLHRLNFETLLVPDPEPHYLIEDVILARAPSLRLLRRGTEPLVGSAPTLLAFGDPKAVDEAFPPLPFAGPEVASIGALFAPGNRHVYIGSRATPSAYRAAEPERFTYVHFAAHAQANPVVPLDSAVVLSARGDEYKLYARDIISIPLDAELVTLSACRSAGGRSFAGEGLVGLSWAFLNAGARHVIGGLWQVEDASTAELMTHLYRELVAGAEPPVALRRAKLELLRSSTAYRKPYYWAPFVTYASRSVEHPR